MSLCSPNAGSGCSVLYKRLSRLFAELQLGRGDGRYPRLFRALTRADLLILDDWGPDRLGPDERRDLLEIFEDRYDNASTLITGGSVSSTSETETEPETASASLPRNPASRHCNKPQPKRLSAVCQS